MDDRKAESLVRVVKLAACRSAIKPNILSDDWYLYNGQAASLRVLGVVEGGAHFLGAALPVRERKELLLRRQSPLVRLRRACEARG